MATTKGDAVDIRLAFGAGGLPLRLPRAVTTVVEPRFVAAVADPAAALAAALRDPVEGPPLRELVRPGLTAANLLADAGWDVLVLEAQAVPGGAVKSAEVTAPGFVSDLYSSFYPLAVGSPVLRDLHLEEHGLAWRHAPSVWRTRCTTGVRPCSAGTSRSPGSR